jgi:hypothetical protein
MDEGSPQKAGRLSQNAEASPQTAAASTWRETDARTGVPSRSKSGGARDHARVEAGGAAERPSARAPSSGGANSGIFKRPLGEAPLPKKTRGAHSAPYAERSPPPPGANSPSEPPRDLHPPADRCHRPPACRCRRRPGSWPRPECPGRPPFCCWRSSASSGSRGPLRPCSGR